MRPQNHKRPSIWNPPVEYLRTVRVRQPMLPQQGINPLHPGDFSLFLFEQEINHVRPRPFPFNR